MTEPVIGERVLVNEKTEATIIALATAQELGSNCSRTFIKVHYDHWWQKEEWHPYYHVAIIQGVQESSS